MADEEADDAVDDEEESNPVAKASADGGLSGADRVTPKPQFIPGGGERPFNRIPGGGSTIGRKAITEDDGPDDNNVLWRLSSAGGATLGADQRD